MRVGDYMIRIAIVDDDQYVCEDIKLQLASFQFKLDTDIEVDTFLSCEELYAQLMNGNKYDLILLDIEFPKMNGVTLSDNIRQILNDIKTQIVFISAKPSYAMDLFSVQPFDFLVKPVTKETLYACLSKYAKHYLNNSMFFEYTYENVRHSIAKTEIVYIKSERKKLRLITLHGEISCYYKFTDAVTVDMPNELIAIKRGLAVNINYIRSTDYETVCLLTGEKFTISEKYRDSVMTALSKRIGGV